MMIADLMNGCNPNSSFCPPRHAAGREKHRHGRIAPCVAITYEAGAGEKTSEIVIQKIFDELPVP